MQISSLLSIAVASQAIAAEVSSPISTRDPVLAALVAEALQMSPEYAGARLAVEADRTRVGQAGALPDPTISLGIQNDGFNEIQIGRMESSYWQVMVTQPFPFPGKRGTRERVASAQADVTTVRLDRIRLSVTSEVERAYVDLLLIRGQLELQAKLEALWKEAEVVARTRYEVGQGPQSDLLRAQLEATRLRQLRAALESNERQRIQALNRLRAVSLETPISTPTTLVLLGDPPLPTAEEMAADAERRSPDLAEARLSVKVADRRLDAARRDRLPDFSVTAGIMPRGSLDPMWLASVGVTVPVFSGKGRAVDEGVARRESEGSAEIAVAQVVRLRAEQRHAALSAFLRINEIYRGTLLVQSDATVRSTLGQYRVGKVTFSSVLEVLRGLVADEGGYLDSLAQAQRLAIAQREVSLEPPAGGAGLVGGSVPGAGTMGGGGGRSGGAVTAGQERPAAGSGGGMTSGM